MRGSLYTRLPIYKFSPVRLTITKVSRPLAIHSIRSWSVTPSTRHIHITARSSLPATLNTRTKGVHPKKSPQNSPRVGTGPNGKRTWKDRIGTAQSRIITRLTEEDKSWKLRLQKDNRKSWRQYIQKVYQQEEQLTADFGESSHWLPQGPEKDRFRQREHVKLLELWKDRKEKF